MITNYRYREMSSQTDGQRRMRFSSYQDLSHLMKRKPSTNAHYYSTQKPQTQQYNNPFEQYELTKSQLQLNNNDIKLSFHTNPENIKSALTSKFSSKIQSRVSSAYQNVQRSSIKRPISAYRNTSLKIANFTSTLDIFQHEIRTARREISLTLEQKNKPSESLQNELRRMKELQSKQINGLYKKFRTKREINQQRSQAIRKDVNDLWYSNEDLKEKVFQMQQRMQKLEIQMGNYSHL